MSELSKGLGNTGFGICPSCAREVSAHFGKTSAGKLSSKVKIAHHYDAQGRKGATPCSGVGSIVEHNSKGVRESMHHEWGHIRMRHSVVPVFPE